MCGIAHANANGTAARRPVFTARATQCHAPEKNSLQEHSRLSPLFQSDKKPVSVGSYHLGQVDTVPPKKPKSFVRWVQFPEKSPWARVLIIWARWIQFPEKSPRVGSYHGCPWAWSFGPGHSSPEKAGGRGHFNQVDTVPRKKHVGVGSSHLDTVPRKQKARERGFLSFGPGVYSSPNKSPWACGPVYSFSKKPVGVGSLKKAA